MALGLWKAFKRILCFAREVGGTVEMGFTSKSDFKERIMGFGPKFIERGVAKLRM